MTTLDEDNLGSEELSQVAIEQMAKSIVWMKVSAIVAALILLAFFFFNKTFLIQFLPANLLFLSLTFVLVYAVVLLWQTGEGFKAYVEKGEAIHLEKAFAKQALFWKIAFFLTLFILLIGFILLYFLSLVLPGTGLFM